MKDRFAFTIHSSQPDRCDGYSAPQNLSAHMQEVDQAIWIRLLVHFAAAAPEVLRHSLIILISA
ncbi:uncharacterized protein PITG_10740 [Phytophthora infestans T30-4]|uniref:Uncharacterized protein n=1 Tax=Phytophthora infestans (strain T30-4) TaxID=403677 RepID=D0NGZ1_PHYIT|nr:uncharacterized protein PITG_10740 [Phytophthora infestans T30-4]EEY58630.1 conserved hypothetical protein [Phytophthora infestans T30-4]|eukprot:XP_002901574.1 conserved hypothetical protein [Phytophthora infestans T30-4]